MALRISDSFIKLRAQGHMKKGEARTTAAGEAALLVGVRIPPPRTKAEEAEARVRERRRARLLAAGDPAKLYQYEKECRAKVKAPQGAAAATREAVAAAKKLFDQQKEDSKVKRGRPAKAGGKQRSMRPLNIQFRGD